MDDSKYLANTVRTEDGLLVQVMNQPQSGTMVSLFIIPLWKALRIVLLYDVIHKPYFFLKLTMSLNSNILRLEKECTVMYNHNRLVTHIYSFDNFIHHHG